MPFKKMQTEDQEWKPNALQRYRERQAKEKKKKQEAQIIQVHKVVLQQSLAEKLFDFYGEDGLYDHDVIPILTSIRLQLRQIYLNSKIEIVLHNENGPQHKKRNHVYLIFQQRQVHMVLWRVTGRTGILYNSGRLTSYEKGKIYHAPIVKEDYIQELKSRGFEVDQVLQEHEYLLNPKYDCCRYSILTMMIIYWESTLYWHAGKRKFIMNQKFAHYPKKRKAQIQQYLNKYFEVRQTIPSKK